MRSHIRSSMLLFVIAATLAHGQVVSRWSASTGDVALSAAGTAATIQQPANGGLHVIIESVNVYCSVACTVTQAANGSAATTTTGTINPVLPTPMGSTAPFNFFTASNVGSGTAQAGPVHVPAGSTVNICLSTICGAGQNVELVGSGTNINYTVTVGSITGTADISFVVRSNQ